MFGAAHLCFHKKDVSPLYQVIFDQRVTDSEGEERIQNDMLKTWQVVPRAVCPHQVSFSPHILSSGDPDSGSDTDTF